MLVNLLKRVKENPKADLDDELFYTLVRACFLGKEVRTRDSYKENYGKRYLLVFLTPGEGEWTTLRQLLLDFTDKYIELDGFVIEDVIIEKGFIEELVSAIDNSTMTAIAEDISSYESAASAVTDEALEFFPDIREWNSDAVLTIPRVMYGNGTRAKERLAAAYRNVLEKTAEAGYTTLSVAPLSDYPLSLECDVASSAASVFFTLHPAAPLLLTFILPDEEKLREFLTPSSI